MATVYLYVLGASSDPDRVQCGVPWLVDDSEVFFGPCKMNIREELRPRLLGPQTDRAAAREDIFFVGFNSLPSSPRVRKVVWAGRLREAMSFGRAWLDLTGPKYKDMRSARATPLHLEPLEGDGRPTAYRHFGLEHATDGKWVDDILPPDSRKFTQVAGEAVRLIRGISWWDGFPRDVCFLFDKLFFAGGAGLEIDQELVSILREAQPDRRGINALAIFGLTRAGIPDGRRGGSLQLTGALADRFLGWLASAVPEKGLSVQGPKDPSGGRPGARARRGC